MKLTTKHPAPSLPTRLPDRKAKRPAGQRPGQRTQQRNPRLNRTAEREQGQRATNEGLVAAAHRGSLDAILTVRLEGGSWATACRAAEQVETNIAKAAGYKSWTAFTAAKKAG
jgi:hypothetical protein